MLSCAGADRLQTGMRHAYGKPMGVSARVAIGQIIMSIRCADKIKHLAREALRRAKFKFPGRQKILESNKWGFTPFDRSEYVQGRQEGWIEKDGNQAKYVSEHGPLAAAYGY
eukprot:scaffold1790_cov257-Pinguiococcus_pyrenoidosus.AAC.31